MTYSLANSQPANRFAVLPITLPGAGANRNDMLDLAVMCSDPSLSGHSVRAVLLLRLDKDWIFPDFPCRSRRLLAFVCVKRCMTGHVTTTHTPRAAKSAEHLGDYSRRSPASVALKTDGSRVTVAAAR
jgi:hypothetical protein